VGSTLAALVAWEEYPQTYTETSSPVSKARVSHEKVDFVSQGEHDAPAAKRIDVAVVSRFINSSLAGNKLYDKDREEARVRGLEKVGGGSSITAGGGISAFVPRAVKAKTATTTTTMMRSWEGREMEGSAMEDMEDGVERDENDERDVMDEVEEQGLMDEQMQDEEEEDPLISGFYKQINLAMANRESKSLSTANTTTTTTTTTFDEPPRTQGNLIIRAFECEPGWCGKNKPEEPQSQDLDSLEIDPPALPFIDSYHKKQKKIAAKQKRLSSSPGRIKSPIPVVGVSPAPADAVSPDIPELSEEQVSNLSEAQILGLRKMGKPVRGARIIFKSMFLDPVRHEPVVAWRWGRISGVEGRDVVIRVLGPKFHSEDDAEIEEGEIEEEEESLEERVGWGELVDVRCWVE